MRLPPKRLAILVGSIGSIGVALFIILACVLVSQVSTGAPIAHTVQATPSDVPAGLPTVYATRAPDLPTATTHPGATPHPGGQPPATATTVPPTHVPAPVPTATRTATPHPTATTLPPSPAPTATPTIAPTATDSPTAKPTDTPTTTAATATSTIAPTVTPTTVPPTATTAPTVTPVIVDPLDDTSLMCGYTMDAATNTYAFYFDTSNPNFFGGDTSRLVRKVGFFDVSVEYCVTGARSVETIVAEANRGQTDGAMHQPIVIESSPDGITWTTDPYTVPPHGSYTTDWFDYDITATLPAGTNYVREGWSPDDTDSATGDGNWDSQIQSITIGR